MKNKKNIIILLTGMFVVILILIGLTYAYFLTRISGNEKDKSINVTTAKLEIKYGDGNGTITTSENIEPGQGILLVNSSGDYVSSKTFSVTNTGNTSALYSIKLDNVTNEFSNPSDIEYILKKNDVVMREGVLVSDSSFTIANGLVIKKGETDSFSIEFNYRETNSNQNTDMAKSIVLKVDIDEVVSSWDNDKNISTPVLSEGMIPVKWDDTSGNWVICEETDPEWYDYDNQLWANIMLSDGTYKYDNVSVGQEVSIYDTGSMFVWIPRFEYKIDSTNEKIYVNFISITDTKVSKDYSYIHPAFTTNIVAGGWDTELNGIWVAKYAAGYQASTVEDDVLTPVNADDSIIYNYDLTYTHSPNVKADGTINSYTTNSIGQDLSYTNYVNEFISYPVFKASTYMYNLISVNDNYLISREIAKNNDFYILKNADSHLLKNSEWSAAAYLAYSSYGRDGIELSVNTMNVANEEKEAYAITGYTENTKATNNSTSGNSTTNNMTGIFDMSGGINEIVAAYVILYTSTAETKYLNYGKTFTVLTSDFNNGANSTKYATSYPAGPSVGGSLGVDISGYETYANNVSDFFGYGDAVLEISKILDDNSEVVGWNDARASYPYSSQPFFIRGGRFDGTKGGQAMPRLFTYARNDGNATSTKTGYRAAIIVD